MATVNRDLSDRLPSENAALESEQDYRLLFEGHPQPMWLYDTETFAFLKANDAAVKQYGYSRDEFLTMTIPQLSAPEDLPKHMELVSRPLPAFDRSGPWRHRLKDGSIIQVLVTSHSLRFGSHNARFVLAEDLTRRPAARAGAAAVAGSRTEQRRARPGQGRDGVDGEP